MAPEDMNEELQEDGGDDEEPPIASEENVRMLDQEAKNNEWTEW